MQKKIGKSNHIGAEVNKSVEGSMNGDQGFMHRLVRPIKQGP